MNFGVRRPAVALVLRYLPDNVAVTKRRQAVALQSANIIPGYSMLAVCFSFGFSAHGFPETKEILS